MAKFVIVIEDKMSGVKVTTDPDLKTLMSDCMRRREDLTPAQAYALKALNAMREASRKLDKLENKSKLITPPGLIG